MFGIVPFISVVLSVDKLSSKSIRRYNAAICASPSRTSNEALNLLHVAINHKYSACKINKTPLDFAYSRI